MSKIKSDPRLAIEPDLNNPWVIEPNRVCASRKGVVSTAQYYASEAGLKILKKGGNAFDAAVASAFALGVCEPFASGLGGQTMMVVYEADTKMKWVIDGSSKAPYGTAPGDLHKAAWLKGHRATTVPSTPAVLSFVLKKFGTKSLRDVLEPAIVLAEKGYKVSPLHHFLMKRERQHLRARSAGRFFLKNGQDPYNVNALLKQLTLGRTLKRLAKEGIEDFYQGKIADSICRDMKKNKGLIQAADLAQIPWPVMRRPITTKFNSIRYFTVPPPAAGRTLIEILNILNEFKEKDRDPDTPKGSLLLGESIKRANFDRLDQPFNPNHYHHSSKEKMTNTKWAKKVSPQIQSLLESKGDTTHLSVMDKQGNCVALTQSIERVYGSFEAAPDLGFLYNNYMSAYEYENIKHPYYLRPGAAPWASVSPTIGFRGTKPWLVIGSPGSERIVSALSQVILRLAHQKPYDAVAAPRIHCSVKNKFSYEASRMRDDIARLFEKRGYKLDPRDAYSFYLGCVQLVMRNSDGEMIGVADPRRDGSAVGL